MNLLANETNLAARAAGEPAAFAAIYDHYFPKVYSYVRYRVNDDDAADEITAQIFEKALKGIASYQPDKAPLGAWLFGIARHAIENHYRIQRRRAWFSFDQFFNHPTQDPPPEEVVTRLDTQQRLLAAVARLKDRERDLIALKFTSGLENVQIARLTGLSESNVGVILYRALRQLRAMLEEKEENHAQP
jgi:RNA polymerase sigma-70 factor (ECF subfamily)